MKRSGWFVTGLVLLVAVLLYFYVPALTKYRNLKQQEEEIDLKIRELDKKIQALSEERDLLKNDRDYLEKVIRKELGLVKPGEIIYKFITEPVKKEREIRKDLNQEAAESVAGVSGTKPVATQPAVIKLSPKKGDRLV